MIIGNNCNACGSDDWIEIARYMDFDGMYEKVTYLCNNCGHVYTINEDLTKLKDVV